MILSLAFPLTFYVCADKLHPAVKPTLAPAPKGVPVVSLLRPTAAQKSKETAAGTFRFVMCSTETSLAVFHDKWVYSDTP